MKYIKCILLAFVLLLTPFVFAQQTVPVSTVLTQSATKVEDGVTFELFDYSERVFSRSKKAELGDSSILRTRFRYQYNENAWASFGFATDPTENRTDNKTSDFELRVGYNYENLNLQIDLTLETQDRDAGGITLGADIDSRNTFLSYEFLQNLGFIFYPFDFNSSTGVNIKNFYVTRIYYIEGAPNQLDTNPLEEESLANKTLPGLELNYNTIEGQDSSGYSVYGGVALGSYFYGSAENFDIRNNASSLNWENRQDFGYKFGLIYKTPSLFSSFQYVGHTEDLETGSLLKDSANFYVLTNVLKYFIFEGELAYSKAGRYPYRVEGNWFEVNQNISVDPRQRVYSDRFNNLQDWVGESGYAGKFSLGIERGRPDTFEYTPYIGYSYFSKYFVYDDWYGFSVSRLRNKNETLGHGGLNVLTIGSYFYKNNFIIHPRFEFLKAKNEVFTNSSDLRNDSIAADFNSFDYQFLVSVSYFYGKRTGPSTFRL